MIRIAILDMNNGQANEGMRCIKMLAGDFLAHHQAGYYSIFDVRGQNEIPDINEFDVFISSGGPGTPFPEDKEWEQPYYTFLDSIYNHNLNHDQKKYLFLICHSFQLAVYHWNMGKLSKRKSTSFGVMPVHKTADGMNEMLFEGLPDPFYAVDSRDYQILNPNLRNLKKMGGKILALEKIRPHVNLERAIMGIRFTPEIIGFQFHPEADSDGMRRYFLRDDKKNHVIKHHGEKKYNDMLAHLDDQDKIMLTEKIIIPKFLEYANNQLVSELTLA